MSDFIKHWKIIQNREIFGKICENNNELLNNILMILDSNNLNDNKTFAIINCLEEKISDYSIVNIN